MLSICTIQVGFVLSDMGWNLSVIIISDVPLDFDESLLKSLLKVGFRFEEELPEETFDMCMYPPDDTVYIGFYKNNLIICHEMLPMLFFRETTNDFEKALMQEFPTSEICAVSLLSSINHFAFTLLKNGSKSRAKGGDSKGTHLDFGKPLEQELQLFSQSRIENGKRVYNLNGETYDEDQVGENIISNVVSRFTGKQLIEDEELSNSPFTGFRMPLPRST